MMCDHVDMRFISERNLRSSKPTKSTAGHRVRINAIAIGRDIRNPIGTMRSIARALGHGGSRVGIGAAVQVGFAMAGDKGSVFVESGFDRYFRAEETFKTLCDPGAHVQANRLLCQP